jgi:hypothetical protein
MQQTKANNPVSQLLPAARSAVADLYVENVEKTKHAN